MEQLVRIIDTSPDGTARVMHVRESACSGDCHKCSGCGAAKETLFLTAKNSIGAKPGDMVRIESATGPVMAGVLVFYVVPVILFFLGYYLGETLWTLGALVGGLGFVLGIALSVVYDRKVARKQKIEYTVVGYAHK
ncbi:MAG: SoxR reducing system RseC family protein [Oscillospiraceae bacterium]|nr:SoxR reducing system RseC family protein [Oscillospiraceae bacterium]